MRDRKIVTVTVIQVVHLPHFPVCLGRTKLEPISVIVLSVAMTLASMQFIRESITKILSLVADPTNLPMVELPTFLLAGGVVGKSCGCGGTGKLNGYFGVRVDEWTSEK